MRVELEPIMNLARSVPPQEIPRLLGDLQEIAATALTRLAVTPAPPPPPAVASPDQLIDVRQAAAHIGMSARWLYRHYRILPHVRIGGFGDRGKGRSRIKFRRSDLDAWLVRRREAIDS